MKIILPDLMIVLCFRMLVENTVFRKIISRDMFLQRDLTTHTSELPRRALPVSNLHLDFSAQLQLSLQPQLQLLWPTQ
jgi:hypothetical protein